MCIVIFLNIEKASLNTNASGSAINYTFFPYSHSLVLTTIFSLVIGLIIAVLFSPLVGLLFIVASASH